MREKLHFNGLQIGKTLKITQTSEMGHILLRVSVSDCLRDCHLFTVRDCL